MEQILHPILGFVTRGPVAAGLLVLMFVSWITFWWAGHCWAGSPRKGRRVRRIALIAAILLTLVNLSTLLFLLHFF